MSAEHMNEEDFKKVLKNEKKFGRIFNFIGVKGGFLINLLTFIRIGFQSSSDIGGKYIQFSIGFYIFNATIQFGANY